MPATVEKNVAIGGSSLYPRYRGEKNMPDKEARAKKDDDAPKKDIEATGKKARAEKKKSSQEEQQQRLADLRREAEEAKESIEKTIREASGSQDPEKVEALLQVFREGGQLKDIPVDREADETRRQEAERRKSYATAGNTEVILETKVDNYPVAIYKQEGKLVLTGLQDTKFKAAVLKEIFKEAGVGKNKPFPKDFDNWDVDERKVYVAENFGITTRDNQLKGAIPIKPVGVILNPIVERAWDQALLADQFSGGEKLSRLLELSDILDSAIADGKITGADADILKGHLNTEVKTINNQLNKQLELRESIENKLEQFDDNFGPVYMRTKALLADNNPANLAANRVALLDILNRVQQIVENEIQTLPIGFDIEDRTTWNFNHIENSNLTVNAKNENEDYHYYRFVFETARAIKQAVGVRGRGAIINFLGGNTPANQMLLDRFVSRDTSVSYLGQMDNFYRYLYKNLSTQELSNLTGDIEQNARLASSSISGGWTTFERRMTELYGKIFNLRSGEPSQETAADRTGLRIWSGLTSIDGVETTVRYQELAKPPAHWRDSEIALDRYLGTIETSGLTGQDAQQFIGQAYQTLTLIPQDIPEGNALYTRLRRKIEAFKFKTTWTIIAHQSSLDPERMEQIYTQEMEGVKEQTFSDVIDRFWRDSHGREYYQTVENGAVLGPGNEKRMNLFDVDHRLYSERYRDDRIRMNMVEQMTKYSIENSFNGRADINRIMSDVDHDHLPAEWRIGGRWERELEEVRQWLKAEWGRVATNPKNSHESWFGDTIDKWAEGNMVDSLTKKVAGNWYVQATLHGASGDSVDPRVAAEIVDKFLADGLITVTPNRDERREWLERILDPYNPMTYLDVRRMEMKRILKNRLIHDFGLQVDSGLQRWQTAALGTANLVDAEIDDLDASGVLGAIDANAYDITWIFQHSTYNIIRVYGKDSLKSKFDDDFQAMVYNKSSNVYNAYIADHNWEYLHPDFELRGRAIGEEEVNKNFRDKLPGKHHWIFPHISMAIRFVSPFLSPADRDLIDIRTKELIAKNHVWLPKNEEQREEFVDFMRGFASRELFESGAISFADKNFSEVAEQKAFSKFAMIDNADDRVRHLKFVRAFQHYLANPEADKLIEIMDKEKLAPSTRNARTWPLMNFILDGHWKVVHDLKYKLFGEPDVTNKEMENFVDNLTGKGYTLKEQGEHFITKNLGIGPWILGSTPFRLIRNLVWEEFKKERQIEGKWGWILALIFAVIWNGITSAGKGVGDDIKKQ